MAQEDTEDFVLKKKGLTSGKKVLISLTQEYGISMAKLS